MTQRRAGRGRPLALIVTCEHGGNRVPREYRSLFRQTDGRLADHRGHDIGALAVARDIARALNAPFVHAEVTRLLVDLNRSIGHPELCSAASRQLVGAARERLLERHYLPYRRAVAALIRQRIESGARVLHVSSHSFTPVLDGVKRNADIGLLYDPARRAERDRAGRWQRAFHVVQPELRVRRNYPYAGRADGFTTALRRVFADRDYAGLELEVNQSYVLAGGPEWHRLRRTIVVALRETLAR